MVRFDVFFAILFFIFLIFLVHDNGQVKSFGDLAGEALNFHKPGIKIKFEQGKRQIDRHFCVKVKISRPKVMSSHQKRWI